MTKKRGGGKRYKRNKITRKRYYGGTNHLEEWRSAYLNSGVRSKFLDSIPITIKGYEEKTNDQTISECVKELIEESFNLYNYLLSQYKTTNKKITIICGGQSPSYYCLSMMNFKIYDPDSVNIIILPHSKHGKKTLDMDKDEENAKYCKILKEKQIELNPSVVIIDGVHSGVGILALESALLSCYNDIDIKKIAINSGPGVSRIKVDIEIYLKSEPVFSDTFPRLVNSYYPSDFNSSNKFITEFNLKNNPIAEMIISISKNYPKIPVEDTEWYKLNNIQTEFILKRKEITRKSQENNPTQERIRKELEELRKNKEKESEEKEEIEKKLKEKGGEFIPIIINKNGTKLYQCPICENISGSYVVEHPGLNFSHKQYCENRYKIPIEKDTNIK